MSDTKKYVQALLELYKLKIDTKRVSLFEDFIKEEYTINTVNNIIEKQQMLTGKWKIKNRIADIQQQNVAIPNGTVGKQYEALIDFQKNGWDDLTFCSLEGLDDIGLIYDSDQKKIEGIPIASGDIKLKLKFRVAGEDDDAELNEKLISLIINPDPKSLWKNIPSNKEELYWKEDDLAVVSKLGDKHLVVSSKRGRSHANVGSFRDDDFAFKHFEETGWSVIAVSDGAGSAKISRKGSAIACGAVVDYFSENINTEAFLGFDTILKTHAEQPSSDTQKTLSHFVYNNLGQAALYVHRKLDEYAKSVNVPIKDLHATLIFTLLKKYDFGYAILSFGVGDCPIGLLNKDVSEISLMNWLDVGEFGGGTRFITMPEIFQSEKFSTRFGYKLVSDFSYLMLMTDGIYDPKFVVEANLEKIECWQSFIKDLNGDNPDGINVVFSAGNTKIAEQLSAWMDFWSTGNHDDRTLAVVF
jgi:hypothetical protein